MHHCVSLLISEVLCYCLFIYSCIICLPFPWCFYEYSVKVHLIFHHISLKFQWLFAWVSVIFHLMFGGFSFNFLLFLELSNAVYFLVLMLNCTNCFCVQFNRIIWTLVCLHIYRDLEIEEARSGVGCESMSKCQEICLAKLCLSYNHSDQ